MRGYELWAYFEESAKLFTISTAQDRPPTEEEIEAADDWRPRRREIKPTRRDGQITADFFASPEDAATQSVLEVEYTFNSPACRKLEFRLVEVGTEGVKLLPRIGYRLEDE